jgi:hypothetical protein
MRIVDVRRKKDSGGKFELISIDVDPDTTQEFLRIESQELYDPRLMWINTLRALTRHSVSRYLEACIWDEVKGSIFVSVKGQSE